MMHMFRPKLVVQSAAILIALSAFKQLPEKTYYPSGKLRSETTYDTASNCEHYTEYYETGKVERELICNKFFGCNQKNYYETGKLRSEKVYDTTCQCSHYTEYYENSTHRKTATYKNGGFREYIDGPAIDYFDNGNIAVYAFYKDYHQDGRRYGNYKNGALGYEWFYKDGYKTGTWKYYNEDKSIKKEEQYNERKTKWDSNNDYCTTTYYLAGKAAYTETYVDGRKTSTQVLNEAAYKQLTGKQPPIGQRVFMANCSQCHNKQLLSKLIQAHKANGTIEKEAWLRQVITSAGFQIQTNYKEKDGYDAYTQHPDGSRLTTEEVNELIAYINNAAKLKPVK